MMHHGSRRGVTGKMELCHAERIYPVVNSNSTFLIAHGSYISIEPSSEAFYVDSYPAAKPRSRAQESASEYDAKSCQIFRRLRVHIGAKITKQAPPIEIYP